MAAELTPMMRQYLALKREIPEGAILMFRLGDFYEMFAEDAVTASPILGATLTKRNGMPMCGVPYHALDSYLAKLIKAGKTAALCDQVEDPKTAKGLVRREITRIVTPGTVTEDGLLDETVNNYVAAVSGLSVALLDLPTGEFLVETLPDAAKFAEAIQRYSPAEVIVSAEADDPPPSGAVVTRADAWTFSPDAACECLTRHFGVTSLDGFGIAGASGAASAAGALLYYVSTTLRHSVKHVRRIKKVEAGDSLVLDPSTIRHLQIVPYGDVKKEATLLGVLDATKTPMGARTLRQWLLVPLARTEPIVARHDAVAAYVGDRAALLSTRQMLSSVRDMERLVQKVDARRANPRDLVALAASLRPVGELSSACLVGSIRERLVPEPELLDLLERAVAPDPPALMADGGFIRGGFDSALDELRNLAQDGRKALVEYQTREQERTGISKLKIRHVSTFGFLIEVPKGSVSQVPADYERRQTLTTGERYVTAELREFERKVLGAQSRAVALEQEIFSRLLDAIALRSASIQSTANAVGELDAVMSFADRALAAGYVRPEIDDSSVLQIEDGRHPVIEQLPDAEPFVPNSTSMDRETCQIMLITGPNMAGKSTYIRQVATIAIMAQAGSFVPCSRMRLGCLDRVFTRIGAGDDLARGRSTFLVEMQETANILNNATGRSLVVLDEIGRGTSTFDGISIAWSVAEYLHGNSKSRPKTLFATHYHELADLADVLPRVKNFTVKVKEEAGRIVFLRRIVPGVAEKSFGIHVAAMAGLPQEVVTRARQILENLEANDMDVTQQAKAVRRPRKKLSEFPGQMTFF